MNIEAWTKPNWQVRMWVNREPQTALGVSDPSLTACFTALTKWKPSDFFSLSPEWNPGSGECAQGARPLTPWPAPACSSPSQDSGHMSPPGEGVPWALQRWCLLPYPDAFSLAILLSPQNLCSELTWWLSASLPPCSLHDSKVLRA